MANGQKIGGIYVEIGADLTNIQSALSAVASIVQQMQDKMKEVKLEVHSKSVREALKDIKALGTGIQTVAKTMGESTGNLNKSILNIVGGVARSTQVIEAFGGTYTDTIRNLEVLLTNLIELEKSPAFQETSEKNQAAIRGMIREARGLLKVLNTINKTVFQELNLKEALKMPEAEAFLGPLRAFLTSLKSHVNPEAERFNSLVQKFSQGEDLPDEEFEKMAQSLGRMSEKAEDQLGIWTIARDLLLEMNSVLTTTSKGEWAGLDEATFESASKLIKGILQDSKNIRQDLQATKGQLEETYGASARKRFVDLDTLLNTMISHLRVLRDTKGISPDTRKEIDNQIKVYTRLGMTIRDLIGETANLDQLSLDIDLKRFGASTDAGKQKVDSLRESLKGAVTETTNLNAVAKRLAAVYEVRKPQEILQALGLKPADLKKAEQWIQDFRRDYDTFWNSVSETSARGSVKVKSEIADMFEKAVADLSDVKIDVAQLAPDPNELERTIALPLRKVEQHLKTLETRFTVMRDQMRLVDPEGTKELDAFISNIQYLRNTIGTFRNTLISAKGDVSEFMKTSVGAAAVNQVQNFLPQFERLINATASWQQVMGYIRMGEGLQFEGPLKQLEQLSAGFRERSVSIKTSWESMKDVIKLGTDRVVGDLKKFREATAAIPDIGLPGFKEFTKISNDLDKLSNSVQHNAQEWYRWNEALVQITSASPTEWAKQQIRDLAENREELKENRQAYEEVGEIMARLETAEGAEKAYNQRINFIRSHMNFLQTTLNKELDLYKEQTVTIEAQYAELAMKSARLMTQELKFEPMQAGLEVSEFQAEVMRKNAIAVREYKLKLEELNAQETLGIQTEKSYQQQLEVMNSIVERAVPLQRQHVEEMIRLGLAAGKTKVRLDALETVLNKLAQIQASRAVFAEQFSAATERMRLFEDKTKNVVSQLGALGVGMDESSQKIIDKFAQMDEIVLKAGNDVYGLRAAFTNVGIVMQQASSKAGISEDAFNAMLESLKALSPETQRLIKSFVKITDLREPQALKKLADTIGKLINELLEPAIQKVRALYTEFNKELKFGKEMETAADKAVKLEKKISDLTLQQQAEGITLENLKAKYKAYQQLQAQGTSLSAKQVRDMKNIEDAMRSLSQQSKNVVDLNIAQSVVKLGAVGSEYDILNQKLKVFKTHMDNLIGSLVNLTQATVKETAKEKEVIDAINARAERVQQLKTLYDSLTSVIYAVQSAQQEEISIDSDKFKNTREEIEKLVAAIKQFTGIEIDTNKLQELGLEYLEQVFTQAKLKVGDSIDGILTKLQQLYAAGEKEFKIGIAVEKTTSDIAKLRENLEVLIGAMDRSGVSVEGLSAQYKIYQDLLARGVITNEEKDRMQQLGQTIEVLKQKFIDIIQIQKDLEKGQAGQLALGRGYDALTSRVNVYKNVMKDLNNSVATVTGKTYEMGNAEQEWQNKVEGASTEINYFIRRLQELDKARIKLERVRELRDKEEFKEARTLLEELNKDLDRLGMKRIQLDTRGLNKAEAELTRFRERASSQLQQTVDELNEDWKKFKPKMEIEGIDAKRSQEMTEIIEKLEIYGEQEKAGYNITEARTKRIEQLNKAMKLSERPQQAALIFLRDQIELETRYIAKLQQEIKDKPYLIQLYGKLAIEQNRLNKLKQLETTLSATGIEGTKREAEAYREVNKTAETLSANIQKLAGRYKGVQQVVNSFISDIKNLILVQIRWYTTQALIFGAVRKVRDVIQFYADLETQVARVTTAIANQYNVTEASAEIMTTLRKEMVRTGQAAEELATVMWELISAGLSHKEAMAGVEHVNNLALAAELELSEATRITAGLFRVFGEEVAKAGSAEDKFRYITDRLAATLNQSQVDMNGLIAGLGYMINEADAAGLQFNEVLGILSVLNNRLLLGSKAGRSASRVLAQLTSNAKALGKAFSIDIDFSKPLDLVDVLTQLNQKLTEGMVNGELTTAQFDKLQDIFGQVGKRAAVGLILNLEELNRTVAALDTGKFEGLTEAMSKIKIETLSTQVKILGNNFKTLMADGLGPIIEVFRQLIELLNKAFEAWNKLGEGTRKFILGSIAVIGILKILAVGLKMKGLLTTSKTLGAIGETAKGVGRTLKTMGTTLGGTITSFLAVARAAGFWSAALDGLIRVMISVSRGIALFSMSNSALGLAIAAIGVGIGYFIKRMKDQERALKTANVELQKARDAYTELLDAIEAEQGALRDLSKEYLNTIPFTREWLQIREKLKNQFPGVLKHLDAEIATTGKVEKSVERWAMLSEKQVKIQEAIRKVTEASNKQYETATFVINKAADSLFRAVPVWKSQSTLVKDLTDDFGKLSKSAKDMGEGIAQILMEGRPLPQNVHLISLAFDELEDRMGILYTLRENFIDLRNTGQMVTADLLNTIKTLPAEVAQQFKKYELRVGIKLEEQEVVQIINDLNKAIQEETDKLSTGISFTPILRAYKQLVKVLEEPVKIEAPEKVKEQLAAANEWMSRLESEMPAKMKAALQAADADFSTLYHKFIVTREKEFRSAADITEVFALQLSAMKEASIQFQKTFGTVMQDYYATVYEGIDLPFEELETKIDLIASIRDSFIEMRNTGKAVTRDLLNSIKELPEEVGKRFEQYDLKIGITLEEGEVVRIIRDLNRTITDQIDRLAEGISFSDIVRRYQEFTKVLEKPIKATGPAQLKQQLEAAEGWMLAIESEMPARMRDTLSKMGSELSALYRQFVSARQAEIDKAEDEVDAYTIKLEAMKEATEKFQETFGLVAEAYYKAVLQEVIKLMRRARTASDLEADVIEGRIRQLWNALTDVGKKSLAELSGDDKAFTAWLESGEALTRETRDKIIENFVDVGDKITKELGPAQRVMIDNAVDLINTIGSSEAAYESLYQTIAKLGAHGADVIGRHLEANRTLIQNVMARLPEQAKRMIQRASLLERIEMIKLVKDTQREIAEEVEGLGIQLTPELKEEITVRKYQEMYEKLKLISKDFYEAEKKLLEESRKRTEKIISEMGDIRASGSARQLEILVAQRDIELKYANKIIAAEKRLESARAQALPEDRAEEYRKLSTEVVRFNEVVNNSKVVIDEMAQRLKILTRMQEEFKGILIGERADTSLNRIFKQNTDALLKFIREDQRVIKDAFVTFKGRLDEAERKFLDEMLQEFQRAFEIDAVTALTYIQTIFKAMVDAGATTFTEGLDKIRLSALEARGAAEAEQVDAMLNLAKRREQLNKIMQDIDDAELRQTAALHSAKLHLLELNFVREMEILQAHETANKNYYNRLSSLRKREIADIKQFIDVYKAVMDPRYFLEISQERLRLEEKARAERIDELNTDIGLYKEYRDKYKKQAEDSNKEMEQIDAAEPVFAPDLQAELDEYKAQIDLLTDMHKRAVKERDDAAKDMHRIRMGEIEDEGKDLQKTRDAKGEEAVKLELAVNRYKRLYKERADAAISEQRREISHTKTMTDQIVLDYKQSIQSMEKEKGRLQKIDTQELAEYATRTLQEVQQLARKRMEESKIKVEAEFLIGKFDARDLGEWEEGLIREIDKFQETVRGQFSKKLDLAIRGGLLDIGEAAYHKTLFEDLLRRIYLDAIETTRDQARSAIREMLDMSLAEISTTAPILRMELDIPSLQAAGIEVEKIFKWQQQLEIKGEDQKKILKEQLDLYMQERQEKEEAYNEAKKEVELLSSRNEDFQDGIRNLIKEGAEFNRLVETAELYNANLEIRSRLGVAETEEDKKKLAALNEQISKQEDIIRATLREGVALNDVIGLLTKAGKLDQDREKAALDLKQRYKDWKDAVEAFMKTGESLAELAKYTGSAWDKALLGMTSALWEFQLQATDWFEQSKALMTTFLEGFTTAIRDTFTALFQPPEEEIAAAQQTLDELYKQRAKVAEEIRQLEVGEVTREEVGRYNELKEQWREINAEIRKARGELDELKDTSKRVADAFRKFGQTILDTLADIIAQLIVAYIIQLAMGWISKGGSSGAIPYQKLIGGNRSIIAAKGGILEGFKPILQFEKGGKVPGGFAPLPTSEQHSLLRVIKDVFHTKFLQAGGIIGSPTLGIVGEGGQAEAVVPLPDNRSIPVSFTGEKGMTQDVKVINLLDPKMVPAIMLQHPEAILNVITEDIVSRGPIYQLIRSLK